MDEDSVEELKALFNELADVHTIIILMIENKDNSKKLDYYIEKRRDLELKIRDLQEL
jgi:hypothetical protein